MANTHTLTSDTYYTHLNEYLTTSKIKTYLKSPALFRQRHISPKMPDTAPWSDALILGALVDQIATEGHTEGYLETARRNLKNPPKTHIEVTPTLWKQAHDIADKLIDSQSFQDTIHFDKQVILSHRFSLKQRANKNLIGVAGMLDLLYIDTTKEFLEATIVDIKTTIVPPNDPKKYLYKCYDYYYMLQMAMYGYLVHKVYNVPLHRISYYHIAITKDEETGYPVTPYRFNTPDICVIINSTLLPLVEEIINPDNTFKMPDLPLDQALTLES